MISKHEPQIVPGVDRQVFHQATPERLVKVRHLVGQLFQRRDEPLKFPPADAALTNFSGKGVPLRFDCLVPVEQ